jgi:hypothetical protein
MHAVPIGFGIILFEKQSTNNNIITRMVSCEVQITATATILMQFCFRRFCGVSYHHKFEIHTQINARQNMITCA